mmetsp:Transcript_13989/g.28650  ORF Transcript_13989/g.28650 Transcript_13989/m.28650 type:complete len:81 (-) Transcript_13989:2110-2352(-)
MGLVGWKKNSSVGIVVCVPEIWVPNEIARMIFGELDQVEDVAAVRGVSKRWKEIVDEHPAVWRRMVFRLPRRLPDQAEKW